MMMMAMTTTMTMAAMTTTMTMAAMTGKYVGGGNPDGWLGGGAAAGGTTHAGTMWEKWGARSATAVRPRAAPVVAGQRDAACTPHPSMSWGAATGGAT